jgi:hypothetical protein
MGTLNIDGDKGANGLLVTNSFVFGSDAKNIKATVNIKCGNGNAIQNDGTAIIWWNFLNCNVTIEGIMVDGVSTSKAMYLMLLRLLFHYFITASAIAASHLTFLDHYDII